MAAMICVTIFEPLLEAPAERDDSSENDGVGSELDMRPIGTIGEFGTGSGRVGSGEGIEFQRPQSVVIRNTNVMLANASGVSDNPAGEWAGHELIVVDAANHRVGRFTLDGELIGWIGSPETAGGGAGSFNFPYGIALMRDGRALVVEHGGGRVQLVDLDAMAGIASYGVPGRGEGELNSPWAVALRDDEPLAYVLDSKNHRVLGFRSPGRGISVGSVTARVEDESRPQIESGVGGAWVAAVEYGHAD